MFIDDATFQIFGSAEEADLEASIYQAVASGTARSAADFDALNQRVFARYEPRSRVDVDSTDYWARDSLYFTDPLYDVNYLYAGLLALRYFTAFEHDPMAFSKNYVALLQNGFTQPPAALERKFLNIDLDDESGLVRNANDFINARTLVLSRLYATAEK
jgi:oligoendopeptidase F